jgi:hypothetical protein
VVLGFLQAVPSPLVSHGCSFTVDSVLAVPSPADSSLVVLSLVDSALAVLSPVDSSLVVPFTG